jgi:hypothetical protein
MLAWVAGEDAQELVGLTVQTLAACQRRVGREEL